MMTNTGYHYKESGLPDVWLRNGYKSHNTEFGGGVSIEDVDGLHAAIGTRLSTGAYQLKGVEIRFLRHELDLSQAALANLLGVDTQTIARWEKDQSIISGPAERLLRAIYLESIDQASSVSALLQDLSALDTEVDQRELCLELSDNAWQAVAA